MRRGVVTAALWSVCVSVLAQTSPPVITTTSLPNGAVGSTYSAQLAATGGGGGYVWSLVAGAGNPPPGLTLSQSGGISGTPTASGPPSNFTVRVTSASQQSATKALSITVNAALVVTTPGTLPGGALGVAYTPLTFSVTGGTPSYTFTATPISPFDPDGVPPGMRVSASGVLSGTPAKTGTFNFNLNVTDSAGAQASKPFSVSITAPLTVTTASPLPPGIVGVFYSQTIAATGGTPPYLFFINNPPPGLTLTNSGVLSGYPTTANKFTFFVGVGDSVNASATQTFQLTISNLPTAQISPLSLTFAAAAQGDSPAAQIISILDNGASLNFSVVIDSGAANSTAPPWLTVKPLTGKTPTVLIVSVDQGNMAAGTYTGRIRIIDSSNTTTDVAVRLVISERPGVLTVAPTSLNLSAIVQSSVVQERLLALDNTGGGGALPFTTQVVAASAWITDITPSSGQIPRNSPALLRVHVNPRGLQLGRYFDVIRVISPVGNVDVPVVLIVTKNAPILSVDVVGLRFQATQGGVLSSTQALTILNLGDPQSTVNWTAEVIKGGDYVTLAATNGATTATRPGQLAVGLKPSATQMAPGAYYALIRIFDDKALNSSQYLVVVLDLAASGSPPLPDPSPEGMFFTAPAGSQPKAQILTVNTSSSSPVPFQANTLTLDGTNWLAASPSTGQASGQSPGTVTVSVNTARLAPGIYFGGVGIAMSATLRVVNVVLVVQPSAGTVAGGTAAAAGPSAACAPAKVAIIPTGTVNNFAVPAKWPATLIAQLADDCGNLISNGSIIASFSNGDPPLSLRGDNTGTYSATWQPGATSADMQVTLRAAAGSLQPATFLISGAVGQNQAPVLARNGTLHNLNPVVGGALAPGTVAQIFGSGLAATTVSPGILPLPTTFNDTFVLVGGLSAPLYFLSDGQLNAQIPSELAPDQTYTVVVSANGAITLPDSIDLTPAVPGVAAFTDGHVIAQHSDFTLVDPAHPARPGETVVIYLAGMGATNPNVASGQPAPTAEPLARVVSQPTVKVDGQNAAIVYAGLTPGFAGLYQINFQVPAGARSSDLDLVVSQGGSAANTTQLRVAR